MDKRQIKKLNENLLRKDSSYHATLPRFTLQNVLLL
jgi:hypothetical protein